jgi:hypothetical protein
MEILFSELFLIFEVSLVWEDAELAGFSLILLSVEPVSDVLFIFLVVGGHFD